MSINLAEISTEEMDRINIDLAASAVAFKERYNMPVVAEMVERQELIVRLIRHGLLPG